MVLREGFYYRIALIADLIVYLVFTVLFVMLPLFPSSTTFRIEDNHLTFVEILFGSMAIFPLIGLFGRLVTRPHIPYNEWSYLVTGFYGMLVLVAFLTVGIRDVYVGSTMFVVFVTACLVGIVGSAGAHVFDGTNVPLGPRIEARLRFKNGN